MMKPQVHNHSTWYMALFSVCMHKNLLLVAIAGHRFRFTLSWHIVATDPLVLEPGIASDPQACVVDFGATCLMRHDTLAADRDCL